MNKALLPLLMLPLPLWASVKVEAPSGSVTVAVQAPKVAAFQPSPNELWVVAGGTRKLEVDPALATRAGWKVEPLQTESGAGVRVVSPQPRTWKVEKNANGWRVVQAAGTTAAMPQAASYIMLNNGLAGGTTATYPGGPRYRVVPTAHGANGGNGPLVETLHGVAQNMDGTAPAMAAARKLAPKPVQQAAPRKGERTFAIFNAPKLAAVATPVESHAAMVEDLFMVEPAAGPEEEHHQPKPPVAAAPVAAAAPIVSPSAEEPPTVTAALDDDVYLPGTVVSFTLPQGFRLENGRLERTMLPNAPRQLAFARAYGAVADAAAKAVEVAETIKTAKPEPVEELPEAHQPPTDLSKPTALSNINVEGTPELPSQTLAPLLPATGRMADYLPGYLRALANLTDAQRRTGAVLPSVSSTIPKEGEPANGEETASTETQVSATVTEAAPEEQKLWYKTPAEVAGNPTVVEARRALADHYLAWQRPTEALAELELQPQRAPGVPEEPEDRLRMAIAHLALKHPQRAQTLLKMDAALRPEDRRIWQAVALQQLGQGASAVETWPAEDMVLQSYPEWLRRMALLSRADALLAAGLKSSARAVADAAAKEYPAYALPPAWVLRQALARVGTTDERAGMDMLAAAAANTTDANTAMHAKYAFVKTLQARNELEEKQVSDYLEELRLFWRGDELEEKVLADLGDAYLKQGDYRNALARWRTLTRVFPNTPGMPAITEKMSTALLGAFDPENPHTYDPITYLGLYFNFRELLPDNDRGDYVMERIGAMLTKSQLPERAIPVLEQVLQYRASEPIDQARLALILAEAYRQFGKPDQALRTLDKYKPMAVNTVQQQQWPLAEARALLDLGKAAEAEVALNTPLADANPDEALTLRSEAAWQLEEWGRLRELLGPAVARQKPENLPNSIAEQVMLLRLAYALTQLNQRPALEALLARYQNVWSQVPHMADSMGALATQAGVANVPGTSRPLAQVAGGLAGLNAFTDQFRQRAADIQRRAEEREEYNAKMRFMDLLPPPSL